MDSAADYRSVADFADREQEAVVRVLLHSDDPGKRYYAALALDRGHNDFSADAFFRMLAAGREDEAVASIR